MSVCGELEYATAPAARSVHGMVPHSPLVPHQKRVGGDATNARSPSSAGVQGGSAACVLTLSVSV
jgi:hypothetical protein